MKKLWILPFLIVALSGIAMAADSFITPAASATVTGSYFINVSTDETDDIQNCTITISSATSGSSSVTPVAVNNSCDGTNCYANITWNSAAVKDATDYSFSASCVNSSNTEAATPSRTSITIDNTVPVCSQSTLTSGGSYDISNKSFTLTATCSNATSATVAFDGNTYTMTESSDTCTYNIGNIPTLTYDTVTVTASDGTNTTDCTAVTSVSFTGQRANQGFTVDVEEIQEIAGVSNKNKTLVAFAVLLLIGAGLVILSKKK